jgi:multiple sugar transport system substrate-binding protein
VHSKLSRRTLLGGIAGTAGVGLFGGCGGGGGAGGAGATSGTIKFWDTVWGPAEYISTAESLVNGYKSPSDGFNAQYQSVDWGNWYQTFSSALASNTGPAVSSGASTQAYQFYDQGQIAPSDALFAKYEEDGTLDDFQPGVFDILRYKGVLVAMPWSYDLRCFWYRPSLLEKAGAEVPTNWDELRQTGLKLKAIGVSGYGVAPTPASQNYKQFTYLCSNNDAPIIDDEGNINCLSDRFIEATEFGLSLVKDGIVTPDMVSYTNANLYSEIAKGTVALTAVGAGALANVTAETQKDFEIMSPITSPSGAKGSSGSVQSIMMYTNTPNQEESEAFLDWYLTNNKTYWDKKVTLNVPLRKSVTESIKDTLPMTYKAGAEYGPNARPEFGKTFTAATGRYDASPALTEWGQKIAQGDGTARALCERLQRALEQIKQESS